MVSLVAEFRGHERQAAGELEQGKTGVEEPRARVVTSNLAIVPTANGWISAFPSNPTHVIVDISGYFGQ